MPSHPQGTHSCFPSWRTRTSRPRLSTWQRIPLQKSAASRTFLGPAPRPDALPGSHSVRKRLLYPVIRSGSFALLRGVRIRTELDQRSPRQAAAPECAVALARHSLPLQSLGDLARLRATAGILAEARLPRVQRRSESSYDLESVRGGTQFLPGR